MSLIDKSRFAEIPTLNNCLGIEFVSIEKEKLVGRMPVDDRTKQVFGIMHGGASGVLVETLASIGSVVNIDSEKQIVVGVELHCRHVNSVSEGWVLGTARPKKIGKNIHFWNVEIVKESDPTCLICEGSCTLFVRNR